MDELVQLIVLYQFLILFNVYNLLNITITRRKVRCCNILERWWWKWENNIVINKRWMMFPIINCNGTQRGWFNYRL